MADLPPILALQQQRSGFEGRLTPQQAEALEELKVKVAQSPFAKEIAEHPDKDRWVLRFLRAAMKDKADKRIFQVDAAYDRLMGTMEWRKAFGVEDMLKAFINGTQEAVKPKHYALFKRAIPNVYVINEEAGLVFRFDRFGYSLSHLDQNAMSIEEWSACTAYEMEHVLHLLRTQSARLNVEVSTYVVQADLHKISLTGIVARRKFVQFFSELGGQHYPEMLGKTFLVRAPWYFDKIWSLVKPFIDKDTVHKLFVSSNIPLEEILKLLPKSLVLKEFGGDNEELALDFPDYSKLNA